MKCVLGKVRTTALNPANFGSDKFSVKKLGKSIIIPQTLAVINMVAFIA